MHNIHKDTLNFDSHFDENYYENIELIYGGNKCDHDPEKPTMLVITGTSGAGKDTIVDHILENFSSIEQVVTATTRIRRYEINEHTSVEVADEFKKKVTDLEGAKKEKLLENAENEGIIVREHYDKYVWMRQKREDESEDDYINNLVKEYELVEHDHHYGNLYGIPKKSIEAVIKKGKVPLFRIDVNGAINLFNMFSEKYNILVLTVLPDKKDETTVRIMDRTTSKVSVNEHVSIRKKAMMEEYRKFSIVTHYYLRNTAISKGDITGMERSFKAARNILNHLKL